MNAKTCKRLRRAAEDMTIGMPARAYRETTRGRTYQYGTDPLTGAPLYATRNNTLALDATGCTRAIYHALKRARAAFYHA